MSSRIAFKVHGRVQGVCFRDFARRNATSYGVTGFVRNTLDGKVTGEAQGDEGSLMKFLKDIDRGPRHAHVVKLEKHALEPKEGENSFRVVH
ncbi:MAG: hypothetical protein M1834_003711 [Cirrosporium novae-zelandiae]|nr:MAG: hypothetical protein M1834_003711 [Cirrosporium novae-zelandiae]